jgi:hypothetical protein
MSLRNYFSRGLISLVLLAVTACSTSTPTQVFQSTQPTRSFNRPTATETVAPAATDTVVPEVTATPDVTSTPSITDTPVATATATTNPKPCNLAAFSSNVTLPDLSSVIPNRTYTKTWQLRNIGSCTWSSDYSIVFISGDKLGPNTSAKLPGAIKPGSYVNVSVSLVMPNPTKTTTYTSYWMLKSDSGEFFGIGQKGDAPFWAKVTIFVH